jgi:hypothetical protein
MPRAIIGTAFERKLDVRPQLPVRSLDQSGLQSLELFRRTAEMAMKVAEYKQSEGHQSSHWLMLLIA